MPFNITDIIGSIKQDGVLKSSKFDVTICPNQVMGLEFTPSELTFRCIAASIPGMTINTTDFKLYGGMPNLKIPISRTTNDLRLTFLTRSDSKDRYFFESWINLISNFSSNTIAYYYDIRSDIVIKIYDENINTKTFNVNSGIKGTNLGAGTNQGTTTDNTIIAYTVTVLNAIPINIDDIDISWADSDKLIEYTVTFSYEQLQLKNNTIMK